MAFRIRVTSVMGVGLQRNVGAHDYTHRPMPRTQKALPWHSLPLELLPCEETCCLRKCIAGSLWNCGRRESAESIVEVDVSGA